MDKIDKFLKKIPEETRREIHKIISLIIKGDLKSLDIKKLKGRENIFRVRRGKIRIIYGIFDGETKILAIEKRSDNTYK